MDAICVSEKVIRIFELRSGGGPSWNAAVSLAHLRAAILASPSEIVSEETKALLKKRLPTTTFVSIFIAYFFIQFLELFQCR